MFLGGFLLGRIVVLLVLVVFGFFGGSWRFWVVIGGFLWLMVVLGGSLVILGGFWCSYNSCWLFIIFLLVVFDCY